MTSHSIFKTFLFLSTSAVALGALFHFEAMPARAAASAASTAASEAAGARHAPIHESPVAPPALDPNEAPAPAPAPAPPSRAVATPDFTGKRLSVARRSARKLGLVVVAHDDEGLRVNGDRAPYYRVRRQSTPAGAGVEPGATVEVSVREIEPPSGY